MIASFIESTIRRSYKPGELRRDAHPKAHGCVKAEFAVDPDIPDDLAQGVFQRGAVYNAWIRFSNGNEDPTRPDYEPDGRGMAIKLLGVKGDRLFDDPKVPNTQDFIMINHPVFLVSDPNDYLDLIRIVNNESSFVRFVGPVLIPLAIGINGTRIALDTTSKIIDNPLRERYWSMVAYRLGNGEPIKFSARPCVDHIHQLPENPPDNFLRFAMQETIRSGEACMEFHVQRRTDRERMSVENVQEEWLETEAPFLKVATITTSDVYFLQPDRMEHCENLAFNPWHGLKVHRPVGAVNRLRNLIYRHISTVRREINSVETGIGN